MTEESGFFDKTFNNAFEPGAADSFHDFRLIYSSQKGFTRIFSAKKNGKIFVLKCLKEEFLDHPLARAALRKEYDCGYTVDSPHVVRTIDFPTLPELDSAIQLEFCPGESLESIIETGSRLTAEDIDRIVDGIISGLADLHAHGIIHRDIKPTNIIYASSTKSLKIIDLGCADAGDFSILHDPAGTERYTPEQVINSEREADASSDFYSAGMTLSRLLPVSPPSRAKALERLAADMIAGKHTDKSSLTALYHTLCLHPDRRLRNILIAGSLTVALAAGTLFLYLERRAEPAQEQHTAVVTDSIAASGLNSTEDAPLPSAESPGSPVPTSDSPSSTSTSPSSAVIADGDKKVLADSHGVSPQEAWYRELFEKDEIDSYTIDTVDSLLSACTSVWFDKHSPSETRNAAYRRYHSFEELLPLVEERVSRKYSGADTRRVAGLTEQRLKLWHSTYAPLPSAPFRSDRQ